MSGLHEPYDELERRTVRRLAEHTIADVQAPDEHVRGAMRRLTGQHPDVSRLSVAELQTYRALVALARGDDRATVAPLLVVAEGPGAYHGPTCPTCGR